MDFLPPSEIWNKRGSRGWHRSLPKILMGEVSPYLGRLGYTGQMGELYPFTRSGNDAEQELKKLNRRFAKVSRTVSRRQYLHWFTRHAKAIVLLLIVAAVAGWQFSSLNLTASQPVSVFQFAKHLFSASNCDSARTVGLAPSHRGQPGYWQHLDADDDGTACEPYPR